MRSPPDDTERAIAGAVPARLRFSVKKCWFFIAFFGHLNRIQVEIVGEQGGK
jgi:hypothetical protein